MEILDKIDWSFQGCKTQYFTHTFHPYPARFIPQIPSTFIKLFTEEGETVLDPMCGCGTTLVEALLHNRNTIGNDLNPKEEMLKFRNQVKNLTKLDTAIEIAAFLQNHHILIPHSPSGHPLV
jgi:DNA modification methylase